MFIMNFLTMENLCCRDILKITMRQFIKNLTSKNDIMSKRSLSKRAHDFIFK